MTRKRRKPDFSLKKAPRQERARQTVDALVGACTWLLPRRGYAGTTTNHIAERAGVNIGSLYEYFPGKDAIVAQVAERLVDRVMARLAAAVPSVLAAPAGDAVRLWIDVIHDTVHGERALIAVFKNEIPYTSELPAVQAVGRRLLDFSRAFQHRAGAFVRGDFSPAALHLLVNLVTSTILQLVHDPPDDVSRDELLGELALHVEWLIRAAPSRASTGVTAGGPGPLSSRETPRARG